MTVRRNRALLALVALVAAGSAPGETPPDLPRVTGAVEISLLNLDVVVTGRDGAPVPGLTAADFEVRHDGKPVKITNFHEERPAPLAPVPPPPTAPTILVPSAASLPPEATASIPEGPVDGPHARRHVIVFVDRLALPDVRERREFFEALKGLLKKGLGPGDEAMVVAWDRTIRTVHPFTGSPVELERALEVAEKGAVRLPGESTEIERLAADDAWFLAAGHGDSELTRRMDAQQAYQEIKGKTAALKGLIAIMAGMDGRKALVIASRRLSRQAGYEFGAAIDTRSLLESVVSAANAAGVTLHTIYSAAWESESPSAATSRNLNPAFAGPRNAGWAQANWNNEMASLTYLSDQTGGIAVGSTMEAGVFAGRVAADLESWYSLGYPVPEGARKSADVSVRVRAPGATVRTRRSILEKTPVEQMTDRVLANLFQADTGARLPIAVIPGTPSRTGKSVRTPVEVRVPVDRLVLVPTADGGRGAFSVFVVSAGPAGDFSEVVRQRKEFEVSGRVAEAAKGSYITYTLDVETRSPDARISIGVWDEVGRDAGFRILRRGSR